VDGYKNKYLTFIRPKIQSLPKFRSKLGLQDQYDLEPVTGEKIFTGAYKVSYHLLIKLTRLVLIG